jgi:hypothetical protein
MANKFMTPEPHQNMGYGLSSDQSEILKIIRYIRDRLDLLPNKITDEISDLFKAHISGVSMIDRERESKEKTLNNEDQTVIKDQSTKKEKLQEFESPLESACEGIDEMTSEQGTLLDTPENSQFLNEQRNLAQRLKLELEDAKVKLEEKQTELESYRKTAETDKCILSRCWPEWLKSNNLSEWRTGIETALTDASSPTSVGLLFAALHTSNAAFRDDDPKTLHDSLREVGRRLYGWLRDLGKSDEDAAIVAEKWGQAINSNCSGRGEVEIPIPGHAANNQWMIFQPRGGSSPDVVSVRTWCVRDAQKRPVHRAEVTV